MARSLLQLFTELPHVVEESGRACVTRTQTNQQSRACILFESSRRQRRIHVITRSDPYG
jgi:hypothetical protein